MSDKAAIKINKKIMFFEVYQEINIRFFKD